MKSILILVVSLFATQSFAQTFGVKFGLAFTKYEAVSNRGTNPAVPRSNITASFKPGLVAGGFAEFRVKENLILRSGLELVTKGSDEAGTYTDITGTFTYQERINFTAFDVPVDLLYRSKNNGPKWFVGGGLTPGLLIESRLNKLDLGANAMTGFAFPAGLEVSLAYTHGLLNVATNSFDYKSLKNRHLSFTFGYHFQKMTTAARSNGAIPTAAAKPPVIAPSEAPNILYAEAGGPGGLLSFNYDTRFKKSYKGMGIRAGLGLLFDFYGAGYAVPVALNYLTGEGASHLELAGGLSYFHFKERNQDSWFNFPNESFVTPFVWVGYRYQPLQKKIVFRAGFTQFTKFGMPDVLQFPAPSLSFGYSLR